MYHSAVCRPESLTLSLLESPTTSSAVLVLRNEGERWATDIHVVDESGSALADSFALVPGGSRSLVAAGHEHSLVMVEWQQCAVTHSTAVAVPVETSSNGEAAQWFGAPVAVCAAILSAVIAGLVARYAERQKASAEWARMFAEKYGPSYFEFIGEIDGLSQAASVQAALDRLTHVAPVPNSLVASVNDGAAALKCGLEYYEKYGLPQMRTTVSRILLRPSSSFRRRSFRQRCASVKLRWRLGRSLSDGS